MNGTLRYSLAIALAVVALAMLPACDSGATRVGIALDVSAEGAVTERITVDGIPVEATVLARIESDGWSVEATSPLTITRSFESPAELSSAERDVVDVLLDGAGDTLGYHPSVVDESSCDVDIKDYLLVRRVSFEYEPLAIEFEPHECLGCAGSGEEVCDTCSGEGDIVCPTCDGKKSLTCPTCSGKGSAPCENCDGKGYEECSSCDGRGWSECYWCSGTGEDDCWSCGGDGKTYDWSAGKDVRCVDCGGDGIRPCSSCDGDGRDECGSCEGDGKRECYACDGDGDLECSSCDAAGKIDCPNCETAGVLTCPDCGARTVVACESCGGTGDFTEDQRATYEAALSRAHIGVAVNLPGVPAVGKRPNDRDAEQDIGGVDIAAPATVSATSWIVDWRWTGAALAATMGLLGTSGVFGYRRIRRGLGRRMAPAEIATSACGGCGAPVAGDAAFCRECGMPTSGGSGMA